ncbi:hypothetical protein ASPACDRAFT_115945 [Aspergillus aculeatus ATCC 16872]|uniref:Uncharacterized protein n=1 Tax=Aspergillus aculeatus (strain ATCC 16872 / CBS 172.66 / WB 5094) TaxID=690307 RepID=A0A1L9WYK0_ASPA1|nr:uncharacterized protein ASPACDRAFT_115945 [Aspergillus aculeatus ATCC 16872]OJK01300.1 hypothetical protein ASPACDRAFT_115945 [Aspergillus aculeatus ATCC 16872]
MGNSLQARGGPYASNLAGMGGLPTTIPDVPTCAVFIVLYICFAATNMSIFQVNRRRGHKFIFNSLMYGFCMARLLTLVLRIVWSQRPTNVSLAIAAQVFVNAGVLILYIINLILAQRILRAKQPQIGWSPILRTTFKILYVLVGGALIMVITAVVISAYTMDKHVQQQCRDAQLAGLTYLLVFNCQPALHIATALLLPKSQDEEKFGEGSSRTRVLTVMISACFCMMIAGFKTGAIWSPPDIATNAPWYDSKACFYVFNFTFEIITLGILTFNRIDKRFWIPNGSTKPGDYTRLGINNPASVDTGSLGAPSNFHEKFIQAV